MSIQEVLDEIQSMNDKFNDLQKDVDELKRANTEKSMGSSPKRRRTESTGAGTSWGDRDPSEKPSYNEVVIFSDEEEESELVEVSDETYAMLTKVCTQSVTNDERKAARWRYKLPNVPATRTPRLDPFLKRGTSSGQVAGQSLSKGTDSVHGCLTTLAESEELSYEDVKKATTTAVVLIGNANSHLLHLRREKLVGSFNKSLLPLVKEDKDFTGTAPHLFGKDFAKHSKEFTDQKGNAVILAQQDRTQKF